MIASVSVGIYQGVPVLDLDYPEDSAADTDMNVIMGESGGFIEVQGTAEGAPFARDELDGMLDLAAEGIDELIARQKKRWRPGGGPEACAGLQLDIVIHDDGRVAGELLALVDRSVVHRVLQALGYDVKVAAPAIVVAITSGHQLNSSWSELISRNAST